MIEDPKCFSRRCKHFLGVSSEENEEDQKVICEAFREGIPDQIAYGSDKHMKPLANQTNEIVYEPA